MKKYLYKNRGRLRYYIGFGSFRGIRIGLTTKEPYAVVRSIIFFELIILYLTVWIELVENDKKY